MRRLGRRAGGVRGQKRTARGCLRCEIDHRWRPEWRREVRREVRRARGSEVGIHARIRKNPREDRGLCGGRYRTRTDDLFRVKEARYQLRQSPIPVGYVNRYYPTVGARDDHPGGHARESLPVWTVADHRLMFHKCPGQQPGITRM